jgi:3-dehydroquinate synthase
VGEITIRVATAPAYDVRIGAGNLASVAAALRERSSVALLSDAKVAPLYAAALGLAPNTPKLVVPAGESSKEFAVLERVLDFLCTAGLDRRGALVALGGGVIGDLGGCAAALYMRGIDFVQVPTTLLAQVDSSVGGKTAVNLRAGKNLAGAFHQPTLVVADTRTLGTLSAPEYRSGLGEVVKTALLEGETALAFLENNLKSVLERDPELLAELVARCVRTKAAVVERDPREAGERKTLNLGHTFAHAIEHEAGYGVIPHGVAVAAGVGLALRAARELGVLTDASLVDRTLALLGQLGLPDGITALRASSGTPLAASTLAAAMRLDKKSVRGEARFVLPERAGRMRLDVPIDARTLERLLS